MGLLLTRRSCAGRWSCWLGIHRPPSPPKAPIPGTTTPQPRYPSHLAQYTGRSKSPPTWAWWAASPSPGGLPRRGGFPPRPCRPSTSGADGQWPGWAPWRGEARRDAATRLRLGLLSAATCARTSALAPGPTQPGRPTRAAAAARAASHPLRSAGDKCAQQGSPSPASALGHPLRRWLIRQPAAPGEAAPARQGDFSLGSLGGKLRHRNTKWQTHAHGRGTNAGSQQDWRSLGAVRRGSQRFGYLGRDTPYGCQSPGPSPEPARPHALETLPQTRLP